MVYMQRRAGAIVGVFENLQPGLAEEQIAADDAAVAAFLHPLPSIADVNDEAERRILAIAPDWKQRNLTAQAVLLTRKIADGGSLTIEEQAAWDAGKGIWDRIKAIRDASNVLNAMATIPSDFADDAHWL